MTRLCILLLLSVSSWAQIYPTRPATLADLGYASDHAITNLSATVTSSSLIFPVLNASAFHNFNIIAIDAEQIMICSASPTLLTACSNGRGWGGTTPTSHNVGASIGVYVDAAYWNGMIPEIISLENSLFGYVNTSGTTFASSCNTAVTLGQTLLVSTPQLAIPTGSYACDLQFLSGGTLQPAGSATVTLSGSITAPPNDVIIDTSLGGTVQFSNLYRVPAEWFSGTDCGVSVNAAYASLPASGGVIEKQLPCTFTTPIVFGTNNKPVILQGAGDATTLTYSHSTGTAITLNYGTGLRMGHGVRDITLTGPGNSTSTVGINVGGSNGAQGFDIRDSKFQSFGTNVRMDSNTWIGSFRQDMIRDGGINVLAPSGLVQAGEQIQFDHVTFADAPAPHTNSVWIQGGGMEYDFTDCAFDQAQLRVGNGSIAAAQINIKGTHFENPNYASGVDYDYITVDNNNGNDISMSNIYMLDDRPSGANYPEFISLNGGKMSIFGIRMYTLVQLTQLIKLANAANVDFFSFNDLAGNTANLFGGSTTGAITSFPGVDTGATSGFNNLITVGDLLGGATLDVLGDVRAKSNQLAATVPTGTAPIVVNSTTPVNNLFANFIEYTAPNTLIPYTTHTVQGQVTLSGGTATVTLSGGAAYSNSSSYQCMANDISTLNLVQPGYISGTQFTFTGNASDNIGYICVGY